MALRLNAATRSSVLAPMPRRSFNGTLRTQYHKATYELLRGHQEIAIDDSRNVNKYTAEVAGVPLFNALRAYMNSSSRCPRAQALTLANVHDKTSSREAFQEVITELTVLINLIFRLIARPFKNKRTPHFLKVPELPKSLSIALLSTHELVESALLPILKPLDNDPTAHTCVSVDIRWNDSHRTGMSIIQIAPHSFPNKIFIIPVCMFKDSLPPSLLRLFASKQISIVSVHFKKNLPRFRKLYPEPLATAIAAAADSIIDLKDYCVIRRVIRDERTWTLDMLCRKVLDPVYLSGYYAPPSHLENNWETGNPAPKVLKYAALDVYASRLVFEKASERLPIERPSVDSPRGTRVALQLYNDGNHIAYGRIPQESRPARLGSVRVRTPLNNRIVLDIDVIIDPSATVDLHKHHDPISMQLERRLRPAFTLGELHDSAPNGLPFQIVTPISLVDFDRRDSEN